MFEIQETGAILFRNGLFYLKAIKESEEIFIKSQIVLVLRRWWKDSGEAWKGGLLLLWCLHHRIVVMWIFV